jgi:hypothetical protein
MLAAPNLDDFMRFAARGPVMVTLQTNSGETPGFFQEEGAKRQQAGDLLDADATRVLNRETPFRLLKESALNAPLPSELRPEALTIAFTRGLMLGQDLSEIARRLAETEPDLLPFTGAYLKETTDDGRRFAAAFLLLHRPEARPYFASGIGRQLQPGKLDEYRDNWWCPMDIEIELDARANFGWYGTPTPNLLQKSAATVTPEFLAGNSSLESKREMDTLETLGAATDFLGGIVLPFAQSHPDDPRVPEALYWVVRAGHYGCADVNTWKTTRAAFRVLHLRYPKTSWAIRTPTWFRNDFDIRQKIKARQSRN